MSKTTVILAKGASVVLIFLSIFVTLLSGYLEHGQIIGFIGFSTAIFGVTLFLIAELFKPETDFGTPTVLIHTTGGQRFRVIGTCQHIINRLKSNSSYTFTQPDGLVIEILSDHVTAITSDPSEINLTQDN